MILRFFEVVIPDPNLHHGCSNMSCRIKLSSFVIDIFRYDFFNLGFCNICRGVFFLVYPYRDWASCPCSVARGQRFGGVSFFLISEQRSSFPVQMSEFTLFISLFIYFCCKASLSCRNSNSHIYSIHYTLIFSFGRNMGIENTGVC